jgi:hypothetical protein
VGYCRCQQKWHSNILAFGGGRLVWDAEVIAVAALSPAPAIAAEDTGV